VPVDLEVQYLAETVKDNAKKYLASVHPVLKKIVVPLSTACGKCEYRANAEDPHDGFKDCWGDLANVTPHILDLYYASSIGGFNGVTADDLIHNHTVSLLDVPEESLRKSDGTIGSATSVRSSRLTIPICRCAGI
jgi:hypothetical protein